MISIKDFSIKKKLIAIQLLTAFIVLLFFGIFVVFNLQDVFRRSVISQLTLMAQLIGANSISALNFLDNEVAEEILSSLATEEDIVNAWIYDADGDLFAKYSKAGYPNFSFPKIEKESHQFSGDYITLSKRIFQDGNIIGMVSLRLYMKQFRDMVKQDIIAAFFVLIAGMIIALLLSVLMKRTISNPILHLVEATKEVSETGNYLIRVKKEGEDEIGVLYDGFNTMLEQIHKRQLERDKAEAALWKSEEKLLRESEDLNIRIQEATNELEQANIKLLEIDQLKNMFIANMSHELRTPLNSIIGFTGILLMGMTGELTAEQKKQLTMVKSSSSHLLALVNDIIDMSKIEAGKAELIIEQFDLGTVMQEVKDSLKVAADKKGLNMHLKMQKGLLIKSDDRRVKQIIVNLVGNAVKFTEEGEVEIKMAEKDGMVEVSVRDTGPGIKNEHMDMLFKPFSQIPIEGVLKEGTGLGLHLSNKLADLLGGEISAESTFGKGSTFTLKIPLEYKEIKT